MGRDVLGIAGWPELRAPADAWWGMDREGRPVTLSYVETGSVDAPSTPVTNEDGSVCAVLAGAVYNSRELRSTLSREHAFKGRDDAELVVHLYEERDLLGVQALRGSFAVILWDTRRRRLVMARDQLGLLPLYYAADGRRLAAASRLAMLVALPGLSDTIDATAVDAFLALGTVPPPGTLHPAIRQLHPGEVMSWEDGRLRGRRYWQLAFPERRLATAGVPGLLRDQLLETLRLRQAGTLPGLLLSGGLGASAVLALAVRDGRPPARAYTASAGVSSEEVRLAARQAGAANVEHVVVDGEPDWVEALDALLAGHGGPVGETDALLIGHAARRAADDGGVVLCGLGGDEVLGGSAASRLAERIRHYHRLPGLVRESAELWSRLAPRPWARSLSRLVQAERLAPLELYARAVSLVLPEERTELYTPETLTVLGGAHPWAALTNLFPEAVSAGAEDTADAIHYVELTLRLPERVAALRAMAAGVDLRLPFTDHRLASLVASMLPTDRATAGTRQGGLRRALAADLPGAVLRRAPIRPFPPASAWASGGLRDLVADTLAPARVESQGLFRADTVARLLSEHESGRRDHGPRLWALLLVMRWLTARTRTAADALRATA